MSLVIDDADQGVLHSRYRAELGVTLLAFYMLGQIANSELIYNCPRLRAIHALVPILVLDDGLGR